MIVKPVNVAKATSVEPAQRTREIGRLTAMPINMIARPVI